MSRKLKFRVWNPAYEEMLYPSSPTKNGDYEEKIYLQLDGQLIGDFKHTGLVNCSENYVIQQFTGCFDKNNKEIYEGDIVKTIYEEMPIAVVQYALEFCSYRLLTKDNKSFALRTFRYENEKPVGLIDVIEEVTGNIFENEIQN